MKQASIGSEMSQEHRHGVAGSRSTWRPMTRLSSPSGDLQRPKKKGRTDDTEEVIRQRLETYRQETAPVIDHYRERQILIEVDGMQSDRAGHP